MDNRCRESHKCPFFVHGAQLDRIELWEVDQLILTQFVTGEFEQEFILKKDTAYYLKYNDETESSYYPRNGEMHLRNCRGLQGKKFLLLFRWKKAFFGRL